MQYATSWLFTNISAMSLKDGARFPRENFVKESAIRKAIFQELAPHLLKDQFLMDQINRYVFSTKTESQKKIYRKAIKKHLRKHTKDYSTSDTLLTMIEGMHYAATHGSLSDNSALDNWLDIKQEEVLGEIDNTSLQDKAKEKMVYQACRAKENG